MQLKRHGISALNRTRFQGWLQRVCSNRSAIPPATARSFFATETLEQFRRDEKWLARASDAIAIYWRERNAHKAQPLRKGTCPLSKVAQELLHKLERAARLHRLCLGVNRTMKFHDLSRSKSVHAGKLFPQNFNGAGNVLLFPAILPSGSQRFHAIGKVFEAITQVVGRMVKRSCGLPVVEFQQASQTLTSADLAGGFTDPHRLGEVPLRG